MKKFLKFFLYFLGVLVLLFVVAFFMRNRIADFAIEKSLQKAFGAKVQADGVYLKPFKAHISWQRLQVTNKNETMRNLFETSLVEFEFAFLKLFSKQIIVKSMFTEGIRLDTKRETDGKLPPPKTKKTKKENKALVAAKDYINREKKNVPVANLLEGSADMDAIIGKIDFKTPKKVDSVEAEIASSFKKWEDLVTKNSYEQKAKSIQNSLSKIDINNLKTIKDFQNAFKIVQKSYPEAEKLLEKVKEDKQKYEQDFNNMRTLTREISTWIGDDYRLARSIVKLSSEETGSFAAALFGEKLANVLMRAIAYVQLSRELQGKPDEPTVADKALFFWLKDSKVSFFGEDGLALSGVMKNLSTNQKISKNPLKIDLAGSHNQLGKLEIATSFDYTTSSDKETFSLAANGLRIRDYTPGIGFLPSKLHKADGSLVAKLNFVNEDILAQLKIHFTDVQFDPASIKTKDKRIRKIVLAIAEKAKDVTITARYVKKGDKQSLSFASTLDKVIKNTLKADFDRQKALFEKKLAAKLNPKNYTQQLNTLLNSKNSKLQSTFTAAQKLKLSDIKDFENQIKKAQEDYLSDEAKKKVKEATKKVEEVIEKTGIKEKAKGLLDKVGF